MDRACWNSSYDAAYPIPVDSWGKRTWIRPPRDVDILFVPASPASRVSLPQVRRCNGDHLAAWSAVLRWHGRQRPIANSLKKATSTPSLACPRTLVYSTGIPVCILVLKKCKKPDYVQFINASTHFEKGKRQNDLSDQHIEKIVDTCRQRPASVERYARRVKMDEIEANDFNLNISRYVSTVEPEAEIDLLTTHGELVEIERQILESTAKHSAFLKELGLSPLLVVKE